jgi:transposase
VDRESLQVLLGQGLSLAEIAKRNDLHEATVGYWVRKHGLEAVNHDQCAARGGLPRAELHRLVLAGMSTSEIADEVGRSKSTVRYWLMRHGLKTGGGSARIAKARARAAGVKTIERWCPRHGEAEFCLDGRGYYRCRQCRSAAVARRRRKVKAILVKEAGSVCCICGYQRSMRALHFHHVEPSQKRLEINAKGVALALASLRLEAQKCVLLCSNCHAEVEDGLVELPFEALERRSLG